MPALRVKMESLAPVVHVGNHGNAGPHRLRDLLHGLMSLGLRGDGCERSYRGEQAHLDGGIGDRLARLRPSSPRRFIRHDAALNRRRRALRERILLMTAGEHRRDARRMQYGIEGRIGCDPPGRGSSSCGAASACMSARVCPLASARPWRSSTRRRIGPERELVVREAHEPRRELIDRVVGAGFGGVTAPVGVSRM